jgi:hypothetical protein
MNDILLKHLAYAEASTMLLESLMLRLVEMDLCTSAQMVSIVEDAIATKGQMISDGEHPDISAAAVGILRSMANSLAASRAAVRID